MSNYSAAIALAINQFLTQDDWHFSFDEEDGIFSFNLTMQNKLKKVVYKVRVRDDSYTVYTGMPLDATDCKAEMAEFLTRANYGLINGNFEMDYRDGEIRYKIHIPCEDMLPSQAVIKRSIYTPAAMFDRYGNGIVAVLFGMQSPEEAVKASEGD